MTMTIDELFDNLDYQYGEKRQEYELEKTRIDNIDMTKSTVGKVDLVNLNSLREDCIKMEGALEAINLVKEKVLGLSDNGES